MKEKLEEKEEEFKALNVTYFEFKDDVEADKEFAKEECKKSKVVTPPGFTKIATCQAALIAKNNSLNTLREKYLSQSTQLGNVTSHLQQCRHDLNSAEDRISGYVKASVANTRSCDQKVADQKKTHDETARGYKRVVTGLQHHLQCLETEENCKDVAGFYTCMPKEMADATCLLYNLVGYELFGLKICNLPGDSVMTHFNAKQFIRENPRVSSLVILLLILASIGTVTLLTVAIWLMVRYRLQLRQGCVSLYVYIRSCCTTVPANASEGVELPPIIKKTGNKKQDKPEKKKKEKRKGGKEKETGAEGNGEEAESDKPSTSGIPKTPPSKKSEDLNKAWTDGKVKDDDVAAANVDKEKSKK